MNTDLLRILYVDDDEDDFLLTEAYFKEIPNLNYELTWSSSYADALQQLQTRKHNLFLFDYLLGGYNGTDLIKEAFALGCEGPIILLTARNDDRTALDTLRLGATDYLLKSELSASTLQRSIRYSQERAAFTKAIQQSERRYRKIFEESGDMLFTTDLQGNLLTYNPAFQYFIALDSSALQRANISTLLPAIITDEFCTSLQSKEEVDWAEITYFTPQKERRICHFKATLETDTLSPYIQCWLRDITEQKRSERERIFSEKMALSNRLIRMLAHEVRNPLTNITLSAEQLDAELEDDDYTFYTEIIKRNCLRINDLITQLLQSSRPTVVNLVPTHIVEVIEEVVQAANDRSQLKHIQIQTEFEESYPTVLLDKTSFHIALLNLIINAIESITHTSGLIKVRVSSASETLKIEVQDNGVGMNTDVLARLFEPYMTKKTTGMGLGLATVLNIIQSHEGRIDVQSEEGKGTCFTIHLPVPTV